MIIVTGGAGFIGSNFIFKLNEVGIIDIIIVERLNQVNFKNVVDLKYKDLIDYQEFINAFSNTSIYDSVDYIVHLGAITNTLISSPDEMLEMNYTLSKKIIYKSYLKRIPIIYASSAAVYGNSISSSRLERPLNIYGYSKFLIDNFVRHLKPRRTSVIGLRFHNVYGPREEYKGSMASMIHQGFKQITNSGLIRLFRNDKDVALRDFIEVSDIVNVIILLMKKRNVIDIFDCGTGEPRSFDEVATLLIKNIGRGDIQYIEMPEKIQENYQKFTKADLTKLRMIIGPYEFLSLEAGVKKFVIEKKEIL